MVPEYLRIIKMFLLHHFDEKNYPFKKEKSDYDYGFCDGVNKEYLKVVKYEVPKIIDQFQPDFIFYLSGVDIFENDKLGKLSVSIGGCSEGITLFKLLWE